LPRQASLTGVAVVTAWLGLCPVASAIDAWPPVSGAEPGRLAAIPPPPSPPRPPILEGLGNPEEAAEAILAEGTGDSDDAADAADALGNRPLPPVAFFPDDPVTESATDDATVTVTPGIPVPTYPLVINAPVEALIDYFVAKERDRFGLWIARSGRYLPLIQRVFRERGLPEELAYTAMIESGFSPRAVSRVGAKGMWQFMEATARRYGLVVNRWIDERLDPIKSTIAAAQYLGDLYGMFGHWFLAQAGYNAGEARVARAIQRARTSDFWALTQTPHLPDETKLFVPQILAAAVITREPGRYGFDVQLQSPLEFDEVPVRRALDLDTIARLAEVSVEAVKDLNPALLAPVTPPFGTYRLRLPPGVGARFEAALRAAAPSSLPAWTVHRISRNQSLADIARMYRVPPQRLIELNHLPNGRLRGVNELLVPVVERPASPAPAGPGARPAAGGREITVRRGDTLTSIAARYHVKVQTLAKLNGLDLDDPLRAGSRLRLTGP
jgi:membrane-bound lytic murein transglycosylase D